MSRARVIVEIESLEQALKVEQTMRTGYCDPIIENLIQWIAVDEDLADSYRKLSEKSTNQDTKIALDELERELRMDNTALDSLLKTVEKLRDSRKLREKLIEELLKTH